MRKISLLTTAFAIMILSACSKENEVKRKIKIDDKYLTECPGEYDCRFFYIDHADVSEYYQLKQGEYKVFTSRQFNNGFTRSLYIKAPMDGDSFELNKEELKAGRAVLSQTCASCYSFSPFTVVDGYIKGINTTPGKPAAESRWLVEAMVMLTYPNTPNLTDMVFVKQYFEPGQLSD